LVGRRRRRCDDAHQLGKSLLIGAPSLRQREGLVAVRLQAETRADFLEAVTKRTAVAKVLSPHVGR
jgi:hypothetical protein